MQQKVLVHNSHRSMKPVLDGYELADGCRQDLLQEEEAAHPGEPGSQGLERTGAQGVRRHLHVPLLRLQPQHQVRADLLHMTVGERLPRGAVLHVLPHRILLGIHSR